MEKPSDERPRTVEEMIAERLREREAMRRAAEKEKPKVDPRGASMLFMELYS